MGWKKKWISGKQDTQRGEAREHGGSDRAEYYTSTFLRLLSKRPSRMLLQLSPCETDYSEIYSSVFKKVFPHSRTQVWRRRS
jgi:hypothetical protein